MENEVALNLEAKSTAELIALYNEKADFLDRPKVKRFADRKSALERTAKIIAAVKNAGSAGKSGGMQATVATAPSEKAKASEKKPAEKKTSGRPAKDIAVREGSNRDKLFAALRENINRFVPISDLCQAVYRAKGKQFKAPLMMVMKGVKGVIKSEKMAFEIKKERKDKENHFGLFSK